MKKLLKNKYFLYIIIAAIGSYICLKEKKNNSTNYTSNFDDINNIVNNDLVDQDFCNSPEMQSFGNSYIIACQGSIGNCSKSNFIGELEIYSQSQITGDPYECSICCGV